MANPEVIEKTTAVVKAAQIATLVKENQLITALVLFCLWQTGALLSLQQHASGVVC